MTADTEMDRITHGFERVLRRAKIRPTPALLERMAAAGLALANRGLNHGPAACLNQVRAANAQALLEEFEILSALAAGRRKVAK